MTSDHPDHLARFYATLADLTKRIGLQQLKDCDGRMGWPQRGVYFFFENGEMRRDGRTSRVVRVGTHAVSKGSRATLWNRLSTHRGTATGGGNHRGSIFRLHVGGALLDRDGTLVPKVSSWGVGSSADRALRQSEAHVEQAVSAYIGSMPFLWVEADDDAGVNSIRTVLEQNSIAMLSRSSMTGETADPPSPGWLGHLARRDQVRRAGLWNIQYTGGEYDPSFLDVFEKCARETQPL